MESIYQRIASCCTAAEALGGDCSSLHLHMCWLRCCGGHLGSVPRLMRADLCRGCARMWWEDPQAERWTGCNAPWVIPPTGAGPHYTHVGCPLTAALCVSSLPKLNSHSAGDREQLLCVGQAGVVLKAVVYRLGMCPQCGVGVRSAHACRNTGSADEGEVPDRPPSWLGSVIIMACRVLTCGLLCQEFRWR